jgi:hypothetical protein
VATSTSPSEKLIDVTAYLRTQNASNITFMVSQDPRWDVTLPSMAAGDTQPTGVTILSTESGNGPRLRLVFNQAPITPPATNKITSINISNNTVSLHFLGTPNRDFIIQSASNLPSSNWLNLSTNNSGSNGAWTFDDAPATNNTRFYRTTVP